MSAKPFRQFSPIVLSKYDFERRSVGKDLSLEAVVTGNVANIIVSPLGLYVGDISVAII